MSKTTLKSIPSTQALEQLSAGKPITMTWITGLLNLDPLTISRWLCGEDMRGIYQPIVIQKCYLDALDLARRTFYERVELVDCRVGAACFEQAYFYTSLLIEDCVFRGDFAGRKIQSEGPLMFHNTVFIGYADFGAADLRDDVSLLDVSFYGGTNLLHEIYHNSAKRIGQEINIRGCRFRRADVPDGLDPTSLGVKPFIQSDLGRPES